MEKLKGLNVGNRFYPQDNSYCINVETGKYTKIAQAKNKYYKPDPIEDGAKFHIVYPEIVWEHFGVLIPYKKTHYKEPLKFYYKYHICPFVYVKSSLTGNIYRVLYDKNVNYGKL